MKKSVFIMVVLIVVSVSLLVACAPAPTATAPTSAATPAATTPAKPIEVVVASPNAGTAAVSTALKVLGDTIEQKSNGRVKFVYYWSNSLMNSTEYIKGVDAGAIGIAYIAGPIANYMPMSWYPFNLPFMGYASMEQGTKIFWELWKKFPQMRDEWKGFKLLSNRLMPPVQIHTSKRQVKTPGDLKGMKICITSAGPLAKAVNAAGGVSVIMLPPEVVQSVTSGIIEGFFDHFPVAKIFKILDVMPYHTIVGSNDFSGLAYGTAALFMKESYYNSFPADIQKMFDEAAVVYEKSSLEADYGEIASSMDIVKKANHTVSYLSTQEIQTWVDVGKATHEEWIKEYEAKGKPARAIYEEAKKLIQQIK